MHILKQEIRKRGIRLNDVAEAANISRFSLSRKLAGLTDFTITEIRAIADFMRLTDEEILSIFFAH